MYCNICKTEQIVTGCMFCLKYKAREYNKKCTEMKNKERNNGKKKND